MTATRHIDRALRAIDRMLSDPYQHDHGEGYVVVQADQCWRCMKQGRTLDPSVGACLLCMDDLRYPPEQSGCAVCGNVGDVHEDWCNHGCSEAKPCRPVTLYADGRWLKVCARHGYDGPAFTYILFAAGSSDDGMSDAYESETAFGSVELAWEDARCFAFAHRHTSVEFTCEGCGVTVAVTTPKARRWPDPRPLNPCECEGD